VIGNLSDGTIVEGVCICKYDQKRDKESWVMLNLKPVR
jgi:hypothetical protein